MRAREGGKEQNRLSEVDVKKTLKGGRDPYVKNIEMSIA